MPEMTDAPDQGGVRPTSGDPLDKMPAVVAPASANRFQLRITLGEMSSSRLSLGECLLAGQDPLDRCPLELCTEDPSAVGLPPVLAHGASRRILRLHGEQSKRGALHGCEAGRSESADRDGIFARSR
jgi:hypothetical protein